MRSRPETYLVWLLRLYGGAGVLAIVFGLMPFGWLQAMHGWLRLGELPASPVVVYLLRATCGLYAGLGGAILLASADIRRYAALVSFIGWLSVAYGVYIGVADVLGGLPVWWVVGEGPVLVAMGIVVLALQRSAGESTGEEG